MKYLPPPDKNRLEWHGTDTQQELLETIQHTETIRTTLGDDIYKCILSNVNLVNELLQNRSKIIKETRLSAKVNYGKKPGHWRVNERINSPLIERLKEKDSLVKRRVQDAVEQVLNVTTASCTNIIVGTAWPAITATYHARGYGHGYASYSVAVKPSWVNSPAARVTELFGNKFFALEADRRADLDYEDVQAFWVNRAVRKQTVGFKDPEVGYAYINSQGDTSFGETPEKARKALQRAVVKRVRARLLRK